MRLKYYELDQKLNQAYKKRGIFCRILHDLGPHHMGKTEKMRLDKFTRGNKQKLFTSTIEVRVVDIRKKAGKSTSNS